MLLTISTTYQPATDLGYLLYKHPARLQVFELPFGAAHVFYPEATEQRCTAALLLEVDPVGLVRRANKNSGFALAQYVNDRPYVASSLLSVAINQVYSTALAGNCRDRPTLATTAIPLEATVTVLPSRGGAELLTRLFTPLGYELDVQRHPLDEAFPDWGESNYYSVTLRATTRLQDLLSHLYVLVPVLDNDKHYYVGDEEVEKLLRHGATWLPTHPEKALIAERYLRYQRSLKREALSRLMAEETIRIEEIETEQDAEETSVEATVALARGTNDNGASGDDEATARATQETSPKRRLTLHDERLAAVLAALKAADVQRVLDLGCGEGRLLALLLNDATFSDIVGVDVSHRALEIAADRLRLDRLPPRKRARIQLLHGSLTYRDERLQGYDAAAVVEVIEHLDPTRLTAFERALFGAARPPLIVLTTPNADYNVRWERLPAGQFRHRDHRFEWSRAEFATWARRVAEEYHYRVRIEPVGPLDEQVGAPSQMGVFEQ